jgi:hypothetical protein
MVQKLTHLLTFLDPSFVMMTGNDSIRDWRMRMAAFVWKFCEI